MQAAFAYIDKRSSWVDSTNDNIRPLIAALVAHIAELESRNSELDAKFQALTAFSERLKESLHEAQLGFRRHERDRIPVSELQLALTLQSKPEGEQASSSTATDTQPAAMEAAPATDTTTAPAPTTETTGAAQAPTGNAAASSGATKPPVDRKGNHGRRTLRAIPRLIINVLPPEVQVEGLEHFEQIGQDDSSVVGHRRGGPVQLVFRRLKFVRKTSAASSEAAESQPSTVTETISVQAAESQPVAVADVSVQASESQPVAVAEAINAQAAESQMATVADVVSCEAAESQPVAVAQVDPIGVEPTAPQSETGSQSSPLPLAPAVASLRKPPRKPRCERTLPLTQPSQASAACAEPSCRCAEATATRCFYSARHPIIDATAGSSASVHDVAPDIEDLPLGAEVDVLYVPDNLNFQNSPFTDGAFVWFALPPPKPDPDNPVLIGSLPARPFDKGMPDASFLAHMIVGKLDYHLPYYRQQIEFDRGRFEVSRANLCRWHHDAGVLLTPIADAMWKQALGRSWFAMDSTGTAIFDRPKYRRGHIFTLVAPGNGILFRYTPDVDGDTILKMFSPTDAIILADACSCHNKVFGPGRKKGSGCWAHARRRWVTAFRAGETQLAATGLELIGKLFRIEDQIALLSNAERLAVRREKSAPLVEQFYRFVEQHCLIVSPLSHMHDAFVYALNQKDLLCRFLSNPDLPISNNCSERALRRVVKGRRNWLFMYDDDRANATCALYSLVASCSMHSLDPEFYLQEVLTVAPFWPADRMLELSPEFWVRTRVQLIREGRLRYIDLARLSGSNLAFRYA